MTSWAIIGAVTLIATMASGEVWAENGTKNFLESGQVWICAIVLFVICYFSYRNPEKHMATTPKEKYFLGYVIYSTFAIFFYLVLTAFPEFFQIFVILGDIDFLQGNKIYEDLHEYLPAFVALITILASVRFPPVRSWHEKLLTNIRKIVNIPVEQVLLAAQLRQGNYELLGNTPADVSIDGDVPNISPKVVDDEWLSRAIKDTLRNDLVNKKDWEFKESDSLNYDWAKAISLFHRYEKAFADPKFRAYSRIFPSQFEERDEKFRKLRDEVSQFIIEVRTFLDEHQGVKGGSLEEHRLIKEQFGKKLTALRDERITPFLESLYEDFAGIVHCCSTTPIGRKQILKEFGFAYAPRMRDLSVPLGLTCVCLLVVIPISFTMVASENVSNLVRFARLFSFELSAVFIALLIADQYLANRSDSPLVGGWVHLEEYMKPLAKALIHSVLVGLALNFVIESVRSDEFKMETNALVFVPAMTAAMLTYLIIQRSYLIVQKWWLEGAILAVATVLAFIVAIFFLVPLFGEAVDEFPYPIVFILAPSMGFAIGCIVPSWSRQKQSELKPLS